MRRRTSTCVPRALPRPLIQIVSGIFPDHELQTGRQPNAYHLPAAFTAVEVHHARRPAAGLSATCTHRRIFLLHRRLSAYVPWSDLRFVQNLVNWCGFWFSDFLGIDGEAFMGYLLPWVKCPSGVRR